MRLDFGQTGKGGVGEKKAEVRFQDAREKEESSRAPKEEGNGQNFPTQETRQDRKNYAEQLILGGDWGL